MNCNNFPIRNKYERLIQEGFELIYPSLYQKFIDIWEYELIGEPQEDLRNHTNNLYYELYRLAEWLVYVEQYLERCGRACLNKEESDKIKSKFLIHCPLICSNDKSLELIKLFESEIPICSTQSYRWLGTGKCLSGDLIYQTLELIQNGVKRLVIVPLTANNQYYLDLGIPQEEATRLINNRIIQQDSSQCCPYDEINSPFIQFISVIPTALTVEYQLNNPQAIAVFELNGQIQTVTQSSGTLIFSGLTASTTYVLNVTVSNCAGNLTLELPIETPPYILTIQIGNNLQGNIQLLNGLQVGNNIIPNHCTQVVVGFEGINTLHKITTFLVDGEDKLEEVIFNQIIGGHNVGGSFTFPCFNKDTTVFIDGERAINCDDINLTITGNTITISV